MASPESDRLIINKASKATAILQFFAVGLVVVLGFIYHDVSDRYTAMQSGIRENAMWSVYQLDREARTLTTTLSVMLASGTLDKAAQRKLATRYDILYSRMDILKRAKFEQYFTVSNDSATRLARIQNAVFHNVGMIDAINAGKPASRQDLLEALSDFEELLVETEQLVTSTNASLSTDRAETREKVSELEQRSLVLIGFLAIIVGAIIVMLRRQLSNVRAAGLSFESMAASLKQAYVAADAGNRAKSQFMATMSHEIRTPLNAILGTVELMELAPPTKECTKNLAVIRHSGEALLEIINEILDYAKIESGKLEIEKRAVDIRSLASDALDMVRGRAVESGNELRLEAPVTLARPYLATDMTRVRQVMLNLLTNALKFTSNGTVTLRLAETGDGGAPRLRVEIADTGIGIDAAGREKLFRPFSQVDASIARRFGGTGLGLTICKEIVERLGGCIGVDSVPGEGSTFWFDIPVETAQAPADSFGGQPALAREDLPSLRILLVEDNPMNVQVATRFLAHLGQAPDVAQDGSVAVTRASEKRYDLILMDMQMPEMDGIEAARRIRAGGGPSAATRIIAMTANASDDDREQCMRAGMDGFQSKPITIAQLHRLLSDAAAAAGLKAEPSAEAAGAVPSAPIFLVDAVGTPDEQPVEASPPTGAEPNAEGPLTPDLAGFLARKREMVEVLGEEDFAELLEGCFDDCARTLADLRIAFAAGDVTVIDRALHSIKGAAGNVGLDHVAHLSQSLREKPLVDSDLGTLQAELDGMRRALAA